MKTQKANEYTTVLMETELAQLGLVNDPMVHAFCFSAKGSSD